MPRALLTAALCALALAGPAQAAAPTGRWLVLPERGTPHAATRALAAAGVERAGPGVPRLGIATVRGAPAALAALRRAPGVERVVPEWSRDLRRDPNDPGWGGNETAPSTPDGTPLQWALRRERFPSAWDVVTGSGALLAVIDSGVDAGHPELSGKIESAQALGAVNPGSDEDGHGTHVSGIACAATDNGAGVAGAGFDCRLAVYKAPEFRDEDIIRALVDATDRGALAVNMSFGGGPPSPAIEPAIDYAYGRGVVLVASAANRPAQDQGSPANQLQPNDGADISKGRGLVVGAVDFADSRPGTGRGPQLSMSAYGFFHETDGPPGILSTYSSLPTARELLLCGCRHSLSGDDRYAYLQGTSMAAPQVAAAALLVGQANPALGAADKIRILKETARRIGDTWDPNYGWGILDAGAAVDAARRVDRDAPSSRARAGRRASLRGGSARVRVRLSGRDPAGGPTLIASGLQRYEIWMRRGRGRYRRVARVAGSRRSAVVRVRRRGRWSLFSLAVDRSGNREARPRRADTTVAVRAR